MSIVRDRIENILQQAIPIGLEEMDAVSLLNRIDRKYIVHIERLPYLLSRLTNDYFVLDIDGRRVFSYKTIYFDTPERQFYKDHHNGLLNRVKVRCRHYVESDHIFFEIKRKYRGYRTNKFRKPVDEVLQELGGEEYDQVRHLYDKHQIDRLDVALHNFFYRATLVSKKLSERVTIDFSLQFSMDGKEKFIPDIAIIEVKQGKYDDRSRLVQLLKKERIYPENISKYIYGLLLMEEQIKYNAFKRLINKIHKIQTTNGGNGKYV